MVLSEAVRSRVVSVLQPWLREEPTVDMKLGFLKSVGSIRNLVLDTSALDSSIRDTTRLVFKSVKVDELSFRICPWSSTTMVVEVRGVRIVLAPRELGDDSICVSAEDSLQKELKDVLTMLDPEGVLIHDIIKDILSTTSSNYRFSKALTRALLQHIEIHFVDVHLQLDMIAESYTCLLKAKGISLEPQDHGGNCLLSGFITSLFVPKKDEFLHIMCDSLNLGLMEIDNDSCLLSSSNVSACIRLNNLQMLGFGVCIPRSDFTFSPAQAPILSVVLSLLSPRECKAVRSGKELWRLATTHINHLHFPSQTSLYRLFNNAVMWIRYVRTYESLLSSVGFCEVRFFGQYSGGVPNPKKCQRLAYMADEIEKKLLPHSVARARIVARHRVSSRTNRHNAKTTSRLLIFYLWKIFPLFSILWDFVYYVFGFIIHAYRALQNILNLHYRTEVSSLFSVVASIGTPSQEFFIVNVEELCITLYPSRVTKNCTNRQEKTDASPPYLDLFSFSILIKTLCFFHKKEKIAESAYLVLGELQVQSSLPSNFSQMRSYLRPGTVRHHKTSPKSGDAQPETILHSEPALLNPLKELTDDDTHTSSSACFLILRKCLGELQTNWMMICEKLNGKSFWYMDSPFLLFGWKRSLVDPDIVSSGYGIMKCCLTVGKLNFVLDYSSILSISLLLNEIQQSLNYIKRCRAPLISSTTPKKPPLNLEENLVFYYNEMNSVLLNIIPDRKLQIGVLISGASVKLSSRAEWPQHYTKITPSDTASESLRNFCFLVHLDRIIFAVWPASRDNLLDSSEDLEDSEQAPKYLWLEEPPVIDILEAHPSETFSSFKRITKNVFWCMKGLSASLKNSEDSQLSPIFCPLSAIIQFSTCRYSICSFFRTTDASSVALRGLLLHTAFFLYTADICALFQELEHIFTLSLSYINNLSFTDVPYPQETLRRFLMSDKKETTRIDYDQYNSMPRERSNFIIDASIDLESMDIILSNPRNLKQMGNTGASSSSYVFDQNSRTVDLPKVGVGVFVKKPSVHLLCEKEYVKVSVGLCGLESILFYQHDKKLQADLSKIKTPENQSFNLLYRFFLSTCRSELYACVSGNSSLLTNVRGMGVVTTEMSAARKGSDTDFHIPTERMIQEILLSSDKKFWLMVDIKFGEVIFAEYHRNNLPIASHQSNKLNIFLSITQDPCIIRLDTKGGCVFMETSALAAFIQSLREYSLCASTLLMSMQNSSEQLEEDPYLADAGNGTTSASNYPGGDFGGTSSHESSLLTVTVDTSQFSITFAVFDESGKVREIIVEADAKLTFKNMGGKLEFVLSRLTIFSQHLREIRRDKTVVGQIPHFHANKSGDMPSFVSSRSERSLTEIEDAYDGPIVHSQDEILSMNDSSQFRSFDSKSYILKHLISSFTLEKTEILVGPIRDYWVGSCSISGFELEITLSEIQMLLDLGAPLSEIPSSQASRSLNPSSGPITKKESSNNNIPDGAIVAIQDVQQHMYFAVAAVGRKYSLVGVLHYSLVGEKALFRVKYQNEKRWMSPHLQQFVLMSLHARNDQGESLCLAFRPGSGFVEISNYDKKTALWEASSYHPDSHDKYDDLRSFDMSSGKAFHLVNSKSHCAVAFVDGLPELVKKPGNPFKLKVIHESDIVNSSITGLIFSVPRDRHISEADLDGSSFTLPRTSQQIATLQQLEFSIDKITLTIFHEVSNENDRLALIRGHVDAFHFTGQNFPSKIRLIGTFRFAFSCFDGQKNSWREMISPVDISLFFRSRFEPPRGSDNSQKKVPIRFYFSTSQVDVSLSELSLDILLYSFWKLNILSPYAVRRSVIFANLCKVENNLSLSLLCNFANNQEAILSGKQSTSILLRLDENAHLSLRLTNHSSFSTSPIEIPVLKPFLFAWRTRVISLEDSRAFPGPFLVLEVSKKAEDGLAVVLSPLLCIHNESGFSVHLRFRRPNEIESESASVFLRHSDTIDDSMAVFDALSYSGGLKKALMSLGLGNFLLSLKPEVSEVTENTEKPTVEWSEDLKGEKAVRVSGIFDKLSYKIRKAFSVKSVKSFFSTISCPLIVDGFHVHDLHFLIQTIGREVPVLPPEKMGDASQSKSSPVAVQLQKEIFILPTIQVSNFLQTDIAVVLAGECHSDLDITDDRKNIGRYAMIACGSSAFFYVNPATIYFTVTLPASNSTCKSVNSSDWLNKLSKQTKEVNYIDIDLDFGEKQFAAIRFSRGERGILKATVYTNYTLENNTEESILCIAYSGKQTMRKEDIRCSSTVPPELGLVLPPKSSRSWLLKSNKLQLTWLEEKASEALLDLDILSGFTEMTLVAQKKAGISIAMKLGVTLTPCIPKLLLPSQIVRLVPRYIISNESNLMINVRQCDVEQDDINWITTIEGKGRTVLYMQTNRSKRRETSFFDAMFRKHRNETENYMDFVQFHLEGTEFSWSGPICIASLGRFFLKFKKTELSPSTVLNPSAEYETESSKFAGIHIVEENSTLVLHFHMPPKFVLPYRIENRLHNVSISFYQKESGGPETLESGRSLEYVWDDLNLPHKLVVQIDGINILREINIDKVCSWKPFLKTRQTRGLLLSFPSENNKLGIQNKYVQPHGFDVINLGYEVLTDGLTRVLRICEFVDSSKEEKTLAPRANIKLRFASLAINLLEETDQDDSSNELQTYSTLLVARLANIAIDSAITDKNQYNYLRIRSITVDEKWEAAPFASLFRKDDLNDSNTDSNMLCFVLYSTSTNSSVIHVKYSSVVLQPIDLNLDEETLMRLLKFWRASISDSETSSTMFYFEHFEIHPIKIRASFLPGNQYSNYSSVQETVRSFLHNVIKIPTINNTSVELNGVLLTHALVTTRELGIKCAKHYSWYLVRAVYIAKGSPLLPPAFASIFDDSASSSLDVFFDPSDGSINLPGVTIGMFKFIKTCISSKGFSGTKRYFGDLGKTVKRAGSNALFAAITEISDSVLLGAETGGFSGMVSGFHQGILKLAMEPSMIGAALMEGGPDTRIILDRSPGVDEVYIEGYLQALLDVKYKQEYLRVRVNDNQVLLKNLPPNSSLINEITGEVRSFLTSKGLLKGETSTAHSIRQLRGESEWRLGTTLLTLCEHLFVSFAIRMLRKQTKKVIVGVRLRRRNDVERDSPSSGKNQAEKLRRVWTVGRFALSGLVAYVDGRLCRHIPNPIARRIVSGFLLSFLEKKDGE